MKKIILSTVATVSILLVSESALATTSESIKTRLKSQESRIQKGSDKGQLTEKEKQTLKNEQKNIKKLIKKLSKDHVFSAKDTKKIHTLLDQASIHIFKKRYNKQTKKESTTPQLKTEGPKS